MKIYFFSQNVYIKLQFYNVHIEVKLLLLKPNSINTKTLVLTLVNINS